MHKSTLSVTDYHGLISFMTERSLELGDGQHPGIEARIVEERSGQAVRRRHAYAVRGAQNEKNGMFCVMQAALESLHIDTTDMDMNAMVLAGMGTFGMSAEVAHESLGMTDEVEPETKGWELLQALHCPDLPHPDQQRPM